MSRSAHAILSKDNLLHNVEAIKSRSQAKIIAMVKANAYGHGLRSVSQAIQHHVGLLGVASIDEALALRKANVTAPIILMEGAFEPSDLLHASEEGFHVVFHNHTQLEWLQETKLPSPIHAWVKIDTGMGRLGFRLSEASEVMARLDSSPSTRGPLKILSHMACADDEMHPHNKIQLDFFQHLKNTYNVEFSLCNSAAFFHYPQFHADYVRPGISLYGASPIKTKPASSLGLKPVMTLKTKIISTRIQEKGSPIGYGCDYKCPEDMPVGVIAFGYGDGYPCAGISSPYVLINKQLCPIVGRISMDMITVDLRLVPNATIGDEVTLWGEGLPIEDVSSQTNHSVYELLTGVQHRVKFFWE